MDQLDGKYKNEYFKECVSATCSLIQKDLTIIDLTNGEIKSFTSANLKQYIITLYKKIQKYRHFYPDLDLKLSVNDGKKFLAKETWADPCWFAIHYLSTCITKDTFEDDLAIFNTYLTSLTALLPCSRCRDHLTENLVSTQVLYRRSFSDGKEQIFYVGFPYNNFRKPIDVFIWTVTFHSFVNSGMPDRTHEFDNYPQKLKYFSKLYSIS